MTWRTFLFFAVLALAPLIGAQERPTPVPPGFGPRVAPAAPQTKEAPAAQAQPSVEPAKPEAQPSSQAAKPAPVAEPAQPPKPARSPVTGRSIFKTPRSRKSWTPYAGSSASPTSWTLASK
jgi:hypothetical protein